MRKWIGLLIVVLIASACDEPPSTVLATTEDGLYTVTLSADPNWVRPNSSLPFLVEVTQNVQPDDPFAFPGSITFDVNGGSVSPPSLSVSFPSDTTAVRPVFQSFVTFRASSVSGSGGEGQAEIRAFFQDTMTTLKLRVVPQQ